MCGRFAASSERRGRPRAGNGMWTGPCGLAHDLPVVTVKSRISTTSGPTTDSTS